MNKYTKSRRSFLIGMGAAGLGIVSSAAVGATSPQECRRNITPVQPEGPFYPIHDQLDKDNDLTRVEGRRLMARGQLIYVRGQVTDQNCAPVAGALVEIWQACESGKYNHPGDDANPSPLDENFQYWGQCVTGQNGEYLFKTIIPGSYEAGEGWIRPPHIHFKIACKGYLELITQMYFAGNELNDRDLILKRLPADERDSVIIDLQPPSPNEEPQSKIAAFNIVLQKLRG
jgi:protocatechuate 3,4-dioxygenase, beta subunit